MYCRFYQGIDLGDLSRESQRSLAFSRTRLNQWAIDLLEGGLRIFSSLSGSEAEAVGREPLSEADYLGEVEAHRNIQVTCIYKILKSFSHLVLGRYDKALEMSDQAEPILYTVGMQGLLPWPEHVFTRLLILTALVPDADENRQAGRRTELVRGLAKLRLWADHSPENFEHKYQLAAGELARLDLRPTEAMGLFEQAIDGAKAGGFVQWEGVANERAARFWQERGNDRLAQMYWQQAYGCFARWGAHAKLQTMEGEYRQWLAADLPQPTDAADVLAELTRNVLLEKQVQLLRSQALQAAEVRMRSDVEKQTGELARATEHLRSEVAERKRIEAELHLHRKQLEERVRERTVALEKSLAERKQAEEALKEQFSTLRRVHEELRESEARLAEAQRIAKIGNWEWNVQNNDLWWSDETFRLFGNKPEEFVATFEAFINAVHPDDRERVQTSIQHALQRDAGKWQIEYRIARVDGAIHFVHEEAETLFDKTGRPLKRVGTVQDITESKLAEEKIRKLNEELEQRVQERTTELEEKNAELHKMNRLFVGRELRMVELKERIKELEGGM
jgi:PAS domain S-box-containing protein